MAGLVAVNYSEALFELAKEEKKLDQFKNDLSAMDDVLCSSEELKQVLKHPKVEKKDKKHILEQIFKDVDPYVINFAKLLIDKNRFAHFHEICKCYYNSYNEYNNIEVAYVQSATKLSDEQIKAIKDMLEKKTNKAIEIKTKINEDLLAGVRIKIKDEILDNSAAARLERMKENVVKTTL